MLLTYKKALELTQAHMAIDGNVVMTEGSGEVRIKVAHNIKTLRAANETAQETKQKIFKELTGGSIKPDYEEMKERVGMRVNEIDNTEVELKLWRIPYDRLNPDTVSPKILAALGEDLIKDMPDLGEPDA